MRYGRCGGRSPPRYFTIVRFVRHNLGAARTAQKELRTLLERYPPHLYGHAICTDGAARSAGVISKEPPLPGSVAGSTLSSPPSTSTPRVVQLAPPSAV